MLGAATNVEDILTTLESGKPPAIVAIDSIQTLWTSALDAAPGTIAQVRTASFDLVRYAKASGAALLLVGHVTKDGQIAGPKAVEHLVDAVLYFEGERGHHFRVLRAVKNRFGIGTERQQHAHELLRDPAALAHVKRERCPENRDAREDRRRRHAGRKRQREPRPAARDRGNP